VDLGDALQAPEMTDRASGRITVVAHENERLVLENLNLTLPGGRAVFEQSRVEVAPGEHVLIVVEHGSDKSALFRAIAGLSPWGAGQHRAQPRWPWLLRSDVASSAHRRERHPGAPSTPLASAPAASDPGPGLAA
jgi:ATPase subunit of ABC transporter with duplicated ATPase domains